MNVYWCHEYDEPYGLYVMAESRGKAKAIYANELDLDYCDVRSRKVRSNVDEQKECTVDVGSPLLGKYGLEYGEEEE